MLSRTARVAAFPASHAGTSSDGRPAAGASATLTGKLAHTGRGSARLNAARNARSARVSFGRATDAAGPPTRDAAQGSPCPSTGAAALTDTQARTDSARPDTQTTRAISPSLDQDKSAEPTELDAPKRRGRVCEPYGAKPSPPDGKKHLCKPVACHYRCLYEQREKPWATLSLVVPRPCGSQKLGFA